MDDASHRDKPQVDSAQVDDRGMAAPIDPGGRHTLFLLTDDEGQRREVSGPLLVGRSPESADADGGAELWALADSTASISKVHALVDIAGASLQVKDLNSTNGTLVNRDGELHRVGVDWFELRPGDRVFFAHRGVVVSSVETSSPRPEPGPDLQSDLMEVSSLFPQRKPRSQPSVLPFTDTRAVVRLTRPVEDQHNQSSLFPRHEPETPHQPPPPPTTEPETPPGRRILQGEPPPSGEPSEPRPGGAGVFDLGPGQYQQSNGPDVRWEQGQSTDGHRCHSCQAHVDSADSFCPECGGPQIRPIISPGRTSSPQRPAPTPSTGHRSTPSRVKVALLVVAVVIGLVILTGILFQLWPISTIPSLQSSI